MVEFACLPCGCRANVQGREGEESACHALGVSTQPLLGLQLLSNCAYRTWVLTSEPVLEPVELLRKECEEADLKSDAFVVPALGEAVVF